MGPHPDSSQWFQTSLSQGHKECQAGRREYNPRWNEKQCAKVNQRHCTRGTGRLKSRLVMSRRFRRNKASLEKSRVVSEAIQKSKETLFFLIVFHLWFCRQDKGPAVANTSRPQITRFPDHGQTLANGKQGSTYHSHQLPDGVAWLCTHTEPVLCAGAVECDFFVRASVGVLVVEIRGTLRDGVVSADDFEGLCAAGRAVFMLV